MSTATLEDLVSDLLARVAQLEAERSARPVSTQSPWRALTLQIEHDAEVGTVLQASGGNWTEAEVDARELCAIVTERVDDDFCVVTLWGQWAASGPVGRAYYPGAEGELVHDTTEDHQAWPVAYQVTPTMRLVVGMLPRLTAQEVTVCADLGDGPTTVPAWLPVELVEE